jgi:redox-sensitive bicupin YhaK (pirin superfamily)
VDTPDAIASTLSIQDKTHSHARKIVFRTRGSSHGPITRLVSPSDLGQLIKPFVFLDLFDTRDLTSFPKFGWHPHSGIATFTFLLEGEVAYSDSTGKSGILPEGGVEWMRAGNGVWHTGTPVGNEPKLGFQLWIALPPAEENAPPESIYLSPSQVPQQGPARVLLGSHEGARSEIPAPGDMTYLGVKLRAGQHWTYTPNARHQVGWLAVASGSLLAGERVSAGELVIFADSEQAIEITADQDTAFVMGSAARHPHELWLGNYSVHTSKERLAQGEAEIRRLGISLRDEGRFRSAD